MVIDHFPQKGDRLFRADTGRLHTVVWNDRHSRRAQILRGYIAASETLSKEALGTSDHSDLYVFPIVYLYRHVFEFGLKAVIETGSGVVDVTPKYTSHRLTPLWPPCRKVLRHLGLDGVGVENKVQELLREFDSVDDGSFTFRYHTDTNGNVDGKIPLAFDLVGFVTTAERLASYIDYIVSAAEERVSYILDMQEIYRD